MADITFTCPHCNQELEAPDDLAGETIDCPACEGQLIVPSPAGAESASPQCPSCGGDMEADAVLCISCGYHLKLRKKIETDLS